jgi:carbon-monoxide dehydrogenase large subunit
MAEGRTTEFHAIGQPIRRKEDRRFLTGNGRYTDDFQVSGQVYAVMVRSPHPHARIKTVDTEPIAAPISAPRA